MSPFKAFTFILLSIAVASFFLGGCASAPPSKTSSEIAVPPVPESQNFDRAQQLQTEQDVSPPPPVSLKEELVFDKNGPEQKEKIPVSYADLEFVRQRFNTYQEKLDRWAEISEVTEKSKLAEKLSAKGFECIQLLEWVLTGYRSLLERMEQGETAPVDETDMLTHQKMLQMDITFLENGCNEVFVIDIPAQPESAPEKDSHYSFDKAQEIIVSHVKNESFHKALLEYTNLSTNYPGQKPAILTELNYGLALQYTGQVEAAARHFRKMLDSGDLSVDPLTLQLKMADLLLASGDIAGAESHYENFIQEHKSMEAKKAWAMEQLAFLRSIDPESEDMIEYTKLFRKFMGYDYKVHSDELNEKINTFARAHAGSPFAVSILRLKAFTIEQLNFWFGRQLVKIDSLVAENKFAEASEILKNMSQYNLPADLQAIVQRTYYEITQAELQATANQRRNQDKKLTEQWDTAVQLMDSQRFDLAISAFESLKGTDYEEQATMKIAEAANMAAGQMRKEAASLFVQAGKTRDLENKKKLLLNSHRLLNEILVKFPQTDLLDKVYQNISMLEEQIRRIDPALLDELQ